MNRFWRWLEFRLSTPEYGGGLLIWLSGFFFAAATNTLSGWLYVISGVSVGLILVGAVLPPRSLADIVVSRPKAEPVSAGDFWDGVIVLENRSKISRALIQVIDLLPPNFTNVPPPQITIEVLAPGQVWYWRYSVPTTRRGIYTIDRLDLVTASPLGLFRSRRTRTVPRPAVVYPLILPLSYCPILDRLGAEESPRPYRIELNFNSATEGLTKNLRPYRWGDPMRLIHWRTSARFGELRVRELEVTTGGQEFTIALDTRSGWQEADFEQAIIAAASLFNYAVKQNLRVSFWSAPTDVLTDATPVYEALAAITIDDQAGSPPDRCLVWLTHRSDALENLPAGSCWLYWGEAEPKSRLPGIFCGTKQPDQNLVSILQSYPQ